MVPSDGNAFERLRREAKLLLKNLRHGNEAATRRFAQYWPATRSTDEVRILSRAQLVIAREHGYRSWTHLKTTLLTAKEKIMNVRKVADELTKLRNQGISVHVFTGNKEQVQSILNELADRGVKDVGRVGPLPTSVPIPDSEVVVGIWPEYAFAYARYVYFPLGVAAEDRREELDCRLGGACVIIAGVSDGDRGTPCIISDKGKTLASVSFFELTSKYRTVIEV